LSWLIGNIGHVHERRGDLAAAETAYEQALGICQQLVAGEPGNRQWQAELGDALDNLGKLAFLRGDLVEALAAYTRNDALKRDLAAADVADYLARGNRAISLQIMGRTLVHAGAVVPAVERLQRAVQLFEQIRLHDPSSPTNVGSQASSLFDLAVALRIKGDPEAALIHADQAGSMIAAMKVSERDEVLGAEQVQAINLERVRLLAAVGRRDEAQDQLATLAAARDELLARDTLDVDALQLVASHVLLAATFATARDQADQARRDAGAALALLDRHAPETRTPTLLVLRLEALLLLARREEARQVADQLRDGGFAQPDLVAMLRAAGLPFAVDRSLLTRITVGLPPLD
jgi:tetratricopeptide (TPR) repeat protein